MVRLGLLFLDNADRLSVAKPHRAVRDDKIAFPNAAQDFDIPGPPRPDLHLAADGSVVFGEEDEIRFADGYECFLRDDDGAARVLQELHGHEQARLQCMVRIVDQGARGDRAGDAIDLRRNAVHLAAKLDVGQGCGRRDDFEAGPDRREIGGRHREVELDGIEIVERGDGVAGRHQRSNADIAQTDDTVEGSADFAVREPGGGRVAVRFRFAKGREPFLELCGRRVLPAFEFLCPLIGGAALREHGFGSGESGTLFVAAKRHEKRIFLDGLAVLEKDLGDLVRNARRDDDAFIGKGRAERFHGIDETVGHSARHDHILGFLLRPCGCRETDTRCQNQNKPVHGHSRMKPVANGQ